MLAITESVKTEFDCKYKSECGTIGYNVSRDIGDLMQERIVSTLEGRGKEIIIGKSTKVVDMYVLRPRI